MAIKTGSYVPYVPVAPSLLAGNSLLNRPIRCGWRRKGAGENGTSVHPFFFILVPALTWPQPHISRKQLLTGWVQWMIYEMSMNSRYHLECSPVRAWANEGPPTPRQSRALSPQSHASTRPSLPLCPPLPLVQQSQGRRPLPLPEPLLPRQFGCTSPILGPSRGRDRRSHRPHITAPESPNPTPILRRPPLNHPRCITRILHHQIIILRRRHRTTPHTTIRARVAAIIRARIRVPTSRSTLQHPHWHSLTAASACASIHL